MIERRTMKARLTPFLLIILAGLLLSMAVSVPASDLNEELARARAATAKYHHLDKAEADGYQFDSCHEGEGCHWFNWGYYDGTFDPEKPEALLYYPTEDGRWRLVAVEYIVPSDPALPPPPAPEGFAGDEDDAYWRFFTEGFADWELTVWIWFNNPSGMFELENPRLAEAGEEH